MIIKFPSLLSINRIIEGNVIAQIAELGTETDGVAVKYASGKLEGFLFKTSTGTGDVVITSKPQDVARHSRVLQASLNPKLDFADLSNATWIRHSLLDDRKKEIKYAQEVEQILSSWVGAFSYIQENADSKVIGLRKPQLGALHAIHSHWAISDIPATVVMPTGTGKTETMLCALITERCSKLLVIVPTDALRTQLAEKFLTLGILKSPSCAVLKSSVRHPIVCTLKHVPKNAQQVDEIFSCSQVIIATSSIAGQCTEEVQEQIAEHCSYLFIDEAHHAEAPTWRAFKERFRNRRIVQFTATPFREDGKPLDGSIIFKYPLKKAQEEGYFKRIQFQPVIEFNRTKADAAIAETAIKQLRSDSAKNHILMARVEGVTQAKQVFELYKQYTEFNPVQLHSGIKSAAERARIRQQIISGHSRIVVCVDMLGEGFDLPELKIAAFHDIRKTLAVTLQLAGRFTRSRSDLGDATFIANVADIDVQNELRQLYSRDPDWNILLPELSDKVIGEQISLQQFLQGFSKFADEIPLKTVRPATSTVVYKTNCRTWTPQNFREGVAALNNCEQIYETINHTEHILVFVTARKVALSWTDVQSLYNWDWELFVVIWSPEQKLLFINSSTNTGEYRSLAKAVAGESVILIRDQQVFRTFAGVTRMRLQNVGLTEQLGRNIRYTGRMGADVSPALPDASRRRARKSVLAGSGFENGKSVTIGASRKGRIWSRKRERIDQLAIWCRQIGDKILDENIDPDEVLKGTLDSVTILKRPEKMPIGTDWPEKVYTTLEKLWTIIINEQEFELSEVSLEIASPSLTDPLRIVIFSNSERAELTLEFFDDDENPNYRFVPSATKRVQIRTGNLTLCAEDFFYEHPPVIWFSDGSSLEGNQLVELKGTIQPFDPSKICTLDWTDIDIRKESQGLEKNGATVQARMIRELLAQDYHVIFDDDSAGEAADIVAIKLVGDSNNPKSIEVEFYHCKYANGSKPGARVKDLYEVCGQAQKSIIWMSSPEKRTDLFTHLLRREAKRICQGGPSRYELGNDELLNTIREMSRIASINLKICIVQPGISKSLISREQLELLSVTETYLAETYQLPFEIIGST